jgi:hypothetical protein
MKHRRPHALRGFRDEARDRLDDLPDLDSDIDDECDLKLLLARDLNEALAFVERELARRRERRILH